ncbi:hypothetical protein M408DRAFT_59824 [Serendipita vermifera MAFF 305830]|uniref:Uncharacterized protein n=1 Tax=Serendipita vermifera MAFF 305830 TaxID=933852 RepID=A0A0C2X811_SERVB|nr:hypothetical protein M408DRAFT_59824 [Serendipita vermifera MAFF 305830]
MREQRKQELYRQEQAALEEARQRQRAKEEKRQAEERRMHMRQDEERRQAWARQQEQERAARQEEERRAQEARIREQNDRMTEMFQARDRSNQINSNMPKRYADAWDAYDEKWRRLASEVLAGGQPSITFATLPWPLLNPPSSPDAITRNAVGAFILSQWHSKNKTPRDRIRDALLRWHPDRFGRYLTCAPEGEERDNVKIGVGNVARSLNELLTKESPSAPL